MTGRAVPRPNTVRYNDWREVDVEPLGAFTPTLPVSVIIPCWQTPEKTLAMTLAALERQTYPRDMFEVVLVDDGSRPPLQGPAATPLNLKVLRQERRGFGLARARNAGARAAVHDVLLFLDSDVLVEKDWMAAHARWHHAVSDVVTTGQVAHVGMEGIDPETIRRRRGALGELFSNRATRNPGTESHLAGTGNLTSRRDDPFRMMAGGNLGIGREFHDLVGGHDESFTRWGFEDIEFGYRAYGRGGLLAPEPNAFAWHQGVWSEGRDAKVRSHQLQRGKAAHLIAHPGFRSDQPGRIFAVPRFVVTVVDADPRRRSTSAVVRAVANVLADRVHDLVVRVETDAADGGERLARLRDEFAPDPRVRVAPSPAARDALDEFPVSPFHVVLPAAGFARGVVHRLRARLGDAVTATAELPDGTTASITRAWALHRARRTGKRPADFGETRTVPARALKIEAAGPADGVDAPEPECYPDTRERLRARARNVHGPGDAWAFLKWLGEGGHRKADTARRAAGQRLRLARRSRRANGGTVRPAATKRRTSARGPSSGGRRVVFVANGLAAGGVERDVVNLAVGLERRRCHVEVLKYAPEDFFAGDLADAGIPVADVHARGRLRLIAAMRKAIRRSRPDVVVAFDWGPNKLAVLAGLPRRGFGVIVSERSLDVSGRRLKRRRLHYALHLLADAVVTNSFAQQGRIVERAPWLEKRIRVIVNGVDLERFSPRPDDGDRSVRADRLRILVPSRIREEKNPVGLLEAVDVVRRERPSLRLVIDWYGDPVVAEDGRVPGWELRSRRNSAKYHRRLRQAIADRRLQDRFRLHPAARDVTRLYRAADAVCLPSFFEGTSNVVCEAMACGVPLLASRVGDNPRLVREGCNGLLFDPESPRDIADAIMRFADTPSEARRRMGTESRRIAEATLSEKAFVDRYVELMEGVSSRGGG